MRNIISIGNLRSFRKSFLAASFALAFGVSEAALAQSESSSGNDFSLFMGYMLPNQIDHVTEILPVFGGRYSFGLPLGAVELEGSNAHAYGVDFTTFSARLRGEIPVAPGLVGLVYGGPDLHYYVPEGGTVRQSEYGLHVGAAGLLLVTDSLWLRADLKFSGNPGTALYLLFGLMFRSSSAAAP